MFLNVYKQTFHISYMCISQKVKSCFNVKSSTYYFHMMTKILTDFQICISVPLILKNPKTLINQQSDLCRKEIPETDSFNSMKNMKNNNTTGNARLTKEFYETFWIELKPPLIESNRALHTKILSFSQRQAVINFIE